MHGRFAPFLAAALLAASPALAQGVRDPAAIPPAAIGDAPGMHRQPGMPAPVWDDPKAPGGIRANPPALQGFEQEVDPPQADVESAERDGFIVEAFDEDHMGDPARDVVEEHFVDPLGATVGRKPPLEFSYALIDLTGSGYKSLVLWPRIMQVQPKVPDFGGVLKVYTFDGTDWHLALDDAAIMVGIRPHFGPDGVPTGYMDLALLEQKGYKLFTYDPAKGEWSRHGGPAK